MVGAIRMDHWILFHSHENALSFSPMNKVPSTMLLGAWTLLAFTLGWAARPLARDIPAQINALTARVQAAVPGPAARPSVQPATSIVPADKPFATATANPSHPLFAVSTPNAAYMARTPSAQPLLEEAWSKVTESFVGDLPNNQQRDAAAIEGALALLGDKYTVYLPPAGRATEREHYAGKFGGIGVTIQLLADGRSQLAPVRNTPADRAGVQKGDILESVDGWVIPPGADFTEIAARVRGEPGTSVTIGVLRGTDHIVIKIIRDQINTPSVDWTVITDTARTTVTVGYIHISSFTDRTGIETRQAITELAAAGASAWLLDLRNNGGGLLSSATDVASQFLKDGNVLIESKRSGENSWPVTKGGLLTEANQPLVVLVNKQTASASEIVAAALQDAHRGAILGERTFGKGVVQLLYDLSDGSSVHVTSSRWFSPNRRTIDGVGVIPDIDLPASVPGTNQQADYQLDRALVELNLK